MRASIVVLGPVAGRGLFGGGCLVENESLIMSGSFEAGERLSATSYSLDLAGPLTIPPDGRLAWQERVPGNKLPGDLQRHLSSVYYIVGGYFHDARLARRDGLENPLGNTTLANEPMLAAPGFRSLPAPSMPLEKKYLQALNEDLRVGCLYNEKAYLIQEVDGRASITVFDANQYTSPATTGPAPKYMKGFSIAQTRNIIHLITPGKVHSLDLNTLVWEEHAVAGLVAAMSGCLYMHKNTLIQAFGMVEGEYSDRTQFVDVGKWELTSRYSPDAPVATIDYGIILASCGCVALLVTLVLATLFLVHRRRTRRREIAPPQYITESVWVTPKPKYSIDMSLNTEPSQSYDFTIDKRPFLSQ